MKAEFIGADGSMGFEKGKIYEVKQLEPIKLIVVSINQNRKCPYSSLENLIANWDFKKEETE